MSSRKAALFGWLVLATLPLGCDTGPSLEQIDVETRMRGVATLYGRYQGQHRGQPPKSQEEFEKYLNSLDPSQLGTFGAASPGELLVSPRDGKPFIVHYGADAGPPGPDGSGPIIVQETAADGQKALGVNSIGQVREIDAAAAP